jgi:hypothetical protein
MRHYTQLLRTAVTAALTLVAMAGAAVAGPLEDANAALQRGDNATAFRLYRPLAEQGNADAQKCWPSCTTKAKALRGTTKRGLSGYAAPLTKATPSRSTFSETCMKKARACHRYAVMLRRLIEEKMTREQIAEAQRLAREWKPKPER